MFIRTIHLFDNFGDVGGCEVHAIGSKRINHWALLDNPVMHVDELWQTSAQALLASILGLMVKEAETSKQAEFMEEMGCIVQGVVLFPIIIISVVILSPELMVLWWSLPVGVSMWFYGNKKEYNSSLQPSLHWWLYGAMKLLCLGYDFDSSWTAS